MGSSLSTYALSSGRKGNEELVELLMELSAPQTLPSLRFPIEWNIARVIGVRDAQTFVLAGRVRGQLCQFPVRLINMSVPRLRGAGQSHESRAAAALKAYIRETYQGALMHVTVHDVDCHGRPLVDLRPLEPLRNGDLGGSAYNTPSVSEDLIRSGLARKRARGQVIWLPSETDRILRFCTGSKPLSPVEELPLR